MCADCRRRGETCPSVRRLHSLCARVQELGRRLGLLDKMFHTFDRWTPGHTITLPLRIIPKFSVIYSRLSCFWLVVVVSLLLLFVNCLLLE